jgi:hypothetical protein
MDCGAGLALSNCLPFEHRIAGTHKWLGDITDVLQQGHCEACRQRWLNNGILAGDFLVVPQTQTTMEVVCAFTRLAGKLNFFFR